MPPSGRGGLGWGLGVLGVAVVLLSVLVLGSYRGQGAPQATPAPSATDGQSTADPTLATEPTQTPVPAAPPGQNNPAPAPPVTVPAEGSNEVRVARFARPAPADQEGRRVRVRVEVENEMPVDPDQAATKAADVLQDRRSWPAKQRVRFDFVGEGTSDLTIRILTPGSTDKRCYPLKTFGKVSCSVGRNVNLNGARWVEGIPEYQGDVDGYRTYLVNHEVGHYLGLGHVECPGAGRSAPVMQQQTKGLDGCRPNPWP